MIVGIKDNMAIVELPPYSAQVAVFVDLEKLNEVLSSKFGTTASATDSAGAVYEVETSGSTFIAVLIEECDINTICHESSHVSDIVLTRMGVPLTLENTEAKAHLVGYCAEHLYLAVGKLNERSAKRV